MHHVISLIMLSTSVLFIFISTILINRSKYRLFDFIATWLSVTSVLAFLFLLNTPDVLINLSMVMGIIICLNIKNKKITINILITILANIIAISSNYIISILLLAILKNNPSQLKNINQK